MSLIPHKVSARPEDNGLQLGNFPIPKHITPMLDKNFIDLFKSSYRNVNSSVCSHFPKFYCLKRNSTYDSPPPLPPPRFTPFPVVKDSMICILFTALPMLTTLVRDEMTHPS